MAEVIPFLGLGLPLAAVLTALFWGLEKRHRGMAVPLFLFLVYLICMVQVVFFSREPGSRHGLDLALFSTWGNTAQSHAYVIENVLLFLPFGMLFPFLSSRAESLLFCTVSGALISVLIETVQLFTGRGYCQTDDVAANALGAFFGVLIFRTVLKRIFGKERKTGSPGSGSR